MTQRMWNNHELKKNYDVVIIGGGAHGLATVSYTHLRAHETDS